MSRRGEDDLPEVPRALAEAIKELDKTLLWIGYATYAAGFAVAIGWVAYILYLKAPGVLVSMWNNIHILAVCVAMMAVWVYFNKGK